LHSQECFPSFNDYDLDFQNQTVKVTVIRDSGEINVGGKTFGPFRIGQEIDTPRWITEELVRSGIVKWKEEDRLDLATLSKMHWRETVPTARQIPAIGDNFYQMLKSLLADLKEQSRSDPVKGRDFEKAVHLSKDIVNCRIKKIASLAASPAQTGDVLASLASEERTLYLALSRIISDWRKRAESSGVER